MNVVNHNGLYYPQDLTPEAINSSQAALRAGTATVNDLQTWGQVGWKTPHGSYSSVERFTGKSLEEHNEFRKALEDYLNPVTGGTSELHHEAVSELGDTVFSLTLLAINASVQLEPALRQTLAQYEGNEHWQQMAGTLAVQNEPLTVADLDDVVKLGLEPALSRHMAIHRDELQSIPTPQELKDRAVWTILYLSQAINNADRQFGWGELLAFAGGPVPEVTPTVVANIGTMVAELYLESAYMANHALGTTLSATLQHTVQKISQRIAANLIDKSDGQRTGLTV